MIQKWTKTEHLKIFNGLIRDFKGYYSSYTPVKILSTKMQKFEKKMIISCQVRTRAILRVKSYLLILASFTGEIIFSMINKLNISSVLPCCNKMTR